MAHFCMALWRVICWAFRLHLSAMSRLPQFYFDTSPIHRPSTLALTAAAIATTEEEEEKYCIAVASSSSSAADVHKNKTIPKTQQQQQQHNNRGIKKESKDVKDALANVPHLAIASNDILHNTLCFFSFILILFFSPSPRDLCRLISRHLFLLTLTLSFFQFSVLSFLFIQSLACK